MCLTFYTSSLLKYLLVSVRACMKRAIGYVCVCVFYRLCMCVTVSVTKPLPFFLSFIHFVCSCLLSLRHQNAARLRQAGPLQTFNRAQIKQIKLLQNQKAVFPSRKGLVFTEKHRSALIPFKEAAATLWSSAGLTVLGSGKYKIYFFFFHFWLFQSAANVHKLCQKPGLLGGEEHLKLEIGY